MNDTLEIVDCTELNSAQLKDTRALNVSKAQEEFGGSFDFSLNTSISDRGETLRGYCYLKQQAVIGIFILKRYPSSPEWVPSDAVSLHGLKIDRRWQGQGLGKDALKLAADAAANIWPDAKNLVLAVDAGNAAALAVYRGFGMEDSGPVYPGRIGLEHRLTKTFVRRDLVERSLK